MHITFILLLFNIPDCHQQKLIQYFYTRLQRVVKYNKMCKWIISKPKNLNLHYDLIIDSWQLVDKTSYRSSITQWFH